MRLLHPALASDQYIFPPPQLLAPGHYFKLLPPALSTSCSTRFATVIGS